MSGGPGDAGATGTGEAGRTSESVVEAAIRENYPALITYLAVGDPSLEASKAYVEALDRGGADLIELGLPFSEPIAEGPTIQGAINRALAAGTTPAAFFDLVDELETEAPLLVMTYYNMVLQYGSTADVRPFVERAAEVGIAGLIVPDLPAEEADPLREACDANGLDLVFIVAPTTEGERLDRIMSRASGFAYVQARLGTTGARADVSTATHDSLTRLEAYDVPKAVGFGVSDGDHAAEIIEAGADGVVVGSALVDIVAEHAPEGADSAGSDADSSGTDAGSTGTDAGSAGPDADPAVEAAAAELEAKARELKRGAERGGESLPEPEQP